MSPTALSLLASILSLPENERLEIADEILAASPEDLEELDDDALLQEIKRRRQEAIDDPDVLIPWSEVKNMR